jgi:ribosome maturation factor RimP
MVTAKTSQGKISPELEAEIAAIAAGAGCELLRASFQRNLLQILLDQPEGGVTLEHCQTVSKQVSALLDLSEFGSDRYVLEVSSPGLDRELFRPADYARFTGSLVRVTFFEGGERKGKKTLVGRLTAFDPATETIALTEEGQPPRTIPLRDVGKARLEIEL